MVSCNIIQFGIKFIEEILFVTELLAPDFMSSYLDLKFLTNVQIWPLPVSSLGRIIVFQIIELFDMVRRRIRMVIIKCITEWPLFTSQYVASWNACEPEMHMMWVLGEVWG